MNRESENRIGGAPASKKSLSAFNQAPAAFFETVASPFRCSRVRLVLSPNGAVVPTALYSLYAETNGKQYRDEKESNIVQYALF